MQTSRARAKGSSSLDIVMVTGNSFPFGSRRWLRQRIPFSSLPPLAPAILAAVTPRQHRIELVDFADVDVRRLEEADVVAMSFATSLASRANGLADRLKNTGVMTVAGGVHPSLLPADSADFFDAVVQGAGETAWPRVLEDITLGRLQSRYVGEQPARIPFAERSVYKRKPFADALEVSRGCTNFCGDFCCVPPFYGTAKYLARPVDDIIAEMQRMTGNILLVDSNLVSRPDFAKELFGRMRPLGKRWVGAGTLQTFIENRWLAPLLAQSGCKVLFVGLETLAAGGVNRRVKKVDSFEQGIEILHRAGIGVEGSFVIGLDQDTEQSLAEIPRFAARVGLEYASLNIATPFPGTGFFKRMDREGRLLTRDWSRYDAEHVVFRPRQFSPEQLKQLYDALLAEVFSLRSITKRSLQTHPLRHAPFVAAANLTSTVSVALGKAARAAGLKSA